MKILFGIITNGKRPAHLLRQIDSIKALGAPDYEIKVAGIVPSFVDVDKIDMKAEAEAGQLGAMRNALCASSDADLFIITDDDIRFHADFLEGLAAVDGDVVCTRMLNPDGTRNWDWVTKGGPRGHKLLEYWETDPYLYCTGGRIVMKRKVWDAVKWDNERGFNQEEDIDFSRRIQAAGFEIKMNKRSTVTHDDPSYTCMGLRIYKVR